jgi:hypothetical protein
MRRISLILACVVAAAATRPAIGEPIAMPKAARLADPATALRACGTPEATPQELERANLAVRGWAQERGMPAPGLRGTIEVAFHVITAGGYGDVTDRQIALQVAELNRGFRGTGLQFRLASVDRIENDGWIGMIPGGGGERGAKQALAVDPAHRLNVYTCAPAVLGWASPPWTAPEGDFMQGVVVHFASLPGGTAAGDGPGRTLVHQVGHYLGLSHLDESGASRGAGFTAGQVARMSEIVPVFRPSLLGSRVGPPATGPEIVPDTEHPADVSRAIEFRGAGPNPFRSETAVRFTIPASERVTLRVFNVAGQLVRTLIDAHLPPGGHSALFVGRDLPAGLYFLDLRVGSAQMTRSVILIR